MKTAWNATHSYTVTSAMTSTKIMGLSKLLVKSLLLAVLGGIVAMFLILFRRQKLQQLQQVKEKETQERE